MQADELLAHLPAFLREQTGAAEVTLADVRLMTGGAVRETWRLDAALRFSDGREQAQQLVLMSYRPSESRAFGAAEEFRLLRAARAAGVPVPEALYVGEHALSQPFYVMQRLQGESIGRRIVKEASLAGAREALPRQLGRTLAAIHRVEWDVPELAFLRRPPAGASPALFELDAIEQTFREAAIEPHPAFELAIRWLRLNAPAAPEISFVHGDFRNGNVLVGEEGLRAVFDWELAHVGDPLEDLGWICVRSWRFGVDALPVGGIGPREPFYDAYAEAAGRAVGREAVRWWEVYGNLRWGVFTLLMTRPFLDGQTASIELASIGRRTAETEIELLALIEEQS
ncbi:MAG TPA: phosphotransferase family protein [Dehalococcoidia bacterium]|nr:phosphotransferase family protein [Dehalococcoidia bacterium]